MCELFSPYYTAWCSQEPKHHTLSSAPRWWSHANPSEKNVALGNELNKFHLQRRILPESFKNHGPGIWQFNLFTMYITWISICIPCQLRSLVPFAFIWAILSWCSFHTSSRSAFHHKTYTSPEYFHYLLWAMQCWKPNSTCLVIQEIYFCSGEIILLLTLKLKYHGKLLSECMFIFVVCKW